MNPVEKLAQLYSHLNKYEKDVLHIESQIEGLLTKKQNILAAIKFLKEDISLCSTAADQYEKLLADFTFKIKQLSENVSHL